MANRLALIMTRPFDQAWRILKVLPMAAMAPTGATGKTVGALAIERVPPSMQVVPRQATDVRRRAETYPPGLTPPTPDYSGAGSPYNANIQDPMTGAPIQQQQ